MLGFAGPSHCTPGSITMPSLFPHRFANLWDSSSTIELANGSFAPDNSWSWQAAVAVLNCAAWEKGEIKHFLSLRISNTLCQVTHCPATDGKNGTKQVSTKPSISGSTTRN